MKLLLLDLDGTVRRPKSGAKFINAPEDQEIIPEAGWAIARYHEAGWAIVGITNQGGAAAGKKTEKQTFDEQMLTLALVPQMRSIRYCPDFEGRLCIKVWQGGIERIERKGEDLNPAYSFRKPGAGMLLSAIAEFKPLTILYVGDRDEDKAAAQAAGVPFLWHQEWWFAE